MKVRVWGCRGSLASPGPDTVKYGGNTSSVEVWLDDGTLIILDAGTGIRDLGRNLAKTAGVKQVNLFLSHLHLDHVEGLGFFSALWNPDVELHVWGPPSPLRSLHDRLATLMSPPLFPVHLADVPSRPIYHDTPGSGTITIGSAKVTVQDVTHRGSTVAYRIEEHGRVFAYIPDHEPALGLNLDQIDLEREDPGWISGYSIAHNADVLFHDSQYTEEEYPSHHAWGHSSIAHTVSFGLITAVKELVLFHHDPAHTDTQLEAHLKRGKELWGTHNTAPVLAHEGMSFELNGSKASGSKPPGP